MLKHCEHEDVGDCSSECFGTNGQMIVKCWNCGEDFDLNVGGRCIAGPIMACPSCPLPEESATPTRLSSLLTPLEEVV